MIIKSKDLLIMQCESDLKELEISFKSITDRGEKEFASSLIRGVRVRIERIK